MASPAPHPESSASILIGALAIAAGIPAATIRFFEAEGLLEPPRRDKSGYRRYNTSALDQLASIRIFQSAGYSLADIRELTNIIAAGTPIPSLQFHVQRLDEHLIRLRKVRAELKAILDTAS